MTRYQATFLRKKLEEYEDYKAQQENLSNFVRSAEEKGMSKKSITFTLVDYGRDCVASFNSNSESLYDYVLNAMREEIWNLEIAMGAVPSSEIETETETPTETETT